MLIEIIIILIITNTFFLKKNKYDTTFYVILIIVGFFLKLRKLYGRWQCLYDGGTFVSQTLKILEHQVVDEGVVLLSRQCCCPESDFARGWIRTGYHEIKQSQLIRPAIIPLRLYASVIGIFLLIIQQIKWLFAFSMRTVDNHNFFISEYTSIKIQEIIRLTILPMKVYVMFTA